MNNQDDAGSFERVALPADASLQGGAPDSRSETFSPREWPTLVAALGDITYAEERLREGNQAGVIVSLYAAKMKLRKILATERSGRPRGERRA